MYLKKKKTTLRSVNSLCLTLVNRKKNIFYTRCHHKSKKKKCCQIVVNEFWQVIDDIYFHYLELERRNTHFILD